MVHNELLHNTASTTKQSKTKQTKTKPKSKSQPNPNQTNKNNLCPCGQVPPTLGTCRFAHAELIRVTPLQLTTLGFCPMKWTHRVHDTLW